MKRILLTLWNKIPTILIIMILLLAISIQKGRHIGQFNTPQQTSTQESSSLNEINNDTLTHILGTPVLSQKVINTEWTELIGQDNTVGYLLNTTTGTIQISGYAGATPVSIVVDNMMHIRGITLHENDESHGFISRIIQTGLLESWNNMKLSDASSSQVECVSGATLSSTAIIETTIATINNAIKNTPTGIELNPTTQTTVSSTNPLTILKHLCSIIVIILSLLCYFFPSKVGKKFRLPLLIASILVIGIWQGAFVSLALLYGWLIHGVTISAKIAVVLTIVIWAFILPLLFNKNYYCAYLCPFGATQEVLGMISKKKITIGVKITKYLLLIKKLYLPLLVIAVVVSGNIDLTYFEPFTIFMINAATISVIIIAVVSMLLSPFINRPWCRFACPTGAFISLMISHNKPCAGKPCAEKSGSEKTGSEKKH